MRLSKTAILCSITLAGLGVWVAQERNLDRARRSLAASQAERTELEQRIVVGRAALVSARNEAEAQNAGCQEALAAVVKAEQALHRIDPESRWAVPPNGWPEWDESSPYVWVRKAILPQVSIPVFTSDGTMQAEIAGVLAVDPASQRSLNDKLKSLMEEYRARVVTRAERIGQALPGIGGEGPQVTVRIDWLPPERDQLKQRFQAALQAELGAQRAELLTDSANEWLYSECGGVDSEPLVISMIRHPNGTYDLSSRSGHSSALSRGTSDISGNIPPFLRPLFAGVWDQTGSDEPPAPGLP